MARRKRIEMHGDDWVGSLTVKRKGKDGKLKTDPRSTYPDPEVHNGYVRVTPKSRAYYVWESDPWGKQVSKKIGTWDGANIDKLRTEARATLERIRAGKSATEPVPVKPDTFADVRADFLEWHVERNGLISAREIKRIIGSDEKPSSYIPKDWPGREFATIRRSDVNGVLNHVERNHGARMADMVLAVLRKMMRHYAVVHDDYEVPLVPGMGRYNVTENARDRHLDDEDNGDRDLVIFWTAAGEIREDFGAIAKLMLLTGQRREKIITMERDHIKNGVWHVPTEARRKGVPKKLPLPPIALELIDSQIERDGNPFVFPGQRHGKPLNAWSQIKRDLDEKMAEVAERMGWPEVEHWQWHDLRRTARSLMSRAGVDRHHAERVLGHKLKGVEGDYDRHDYGPEAKRALQRLAKTITKIVTPPYDAEVIDLRKAS